VLNLGSYPRFVAVLGFIDCVDLAIEAVASVRKIPRVRRMLVNKVCPTVIALVAPDPRLLAVQQIGQLPRDRPRWPPIPELYG